MPRVPINYAKTVIYKIVCNDLSITECYVGHTTDFVRRRQNHKYHCTHENDEKHNLKIYKTIRENE
jgi:predicted GIY-YIG superfamily endonuclease